MTSFKIDVDPSLVSFGAGKLESRNLAAADVKTTKTHNIKSGETYVGGSEKPAPAVSHDKGDSQILWGRSPKC